MREPDLTFMIPLSEPELTGNEARYLAECITSNYVSSVGPFVGRFEVMVAAASGRGGAVATSSGTAALHAALIALGVKPGDLVVMPAFTFIATANAVSYCGARPAFLDVSTDSWTLAPSALEEFLGVRCDRNAASVVHRETGARVAVVIAVHTLGHPADMDALEGICAQYGLPLLCDAAAALGATYNGGVATARGTIATISFNGNKTVTAGGGGAVVCDDPALLTTVRHLTTTARVSTDYQHDRVGFNYRMTNVHAAIGCAQLERLPDLVARKRQIADRYDRAFSECSMLRPFPRAAWAESACWFSGVVLADESATRGFDLAERLGKEGIGARPFWRPMHLQPMYGDCVRDSLSVTERVWPHIVTLPCSTGLSQADQDFVIAAVRRVTATASEAMT